MATNVNETRKLVCGILTKMGVNDASKLAAERALAKLGHRIKANGVPEGLTDDEINYLKGMGLWPRETAPETAASSDDETPPADASSEDDARAEAEADEAALADPDDDPKTPSGKRPSEAAAERASAKKAAKAAKAKNADGKPAKKAKNEGGRRGMEIFKNLLGDGDRVAKERVIEQVMTAGTSKASALAYTCWAKRPANQPDASLGMYNPFPFRIKETKDDNGTKWLQKTSGGGKK